MLDQAASVHPDAWWWIKTDGVDIVRGLGESMRGEWSGDIDLNDGSLKIMYDEHQKLLKFIDDMGIVQSCYITELKEVDELLLKDLIHITKCKNKYRKCMR